ncbi:3-carboxy-cis,cis-muconate cycloisomerase [Pseudovibrio sp. Ad26]|uniref:3-carboxy-cis,cis-muconate cycloisomerase n=1 Tax=Pseudovibrio sp. Ad26 TaxID=989410 RepID=UPI0007AE5352|nr:3-carboxy-cis,cis-muconate cycloisomerase [Pseudovibrio sp. Ad26]KZL13447.1 3-carboxy-cis,cis-muconate cycloisomerase [Pseudovibrio sp. Ad26]
MSVSLFTNPMWSGLFGDEDVQRAFALETTLDHYLAYEVALTKALFAHSLISAEAKDAVLAGCKGFAPDITRIKAGVAKDGLPIPAFIKQLRMRIGEPYAAECHKTSTSQDVMDTALALALQKTSQILQKRLSAVIAALETVKSANSDYPLMGRTRMQAALPITAGDRISTWIEPLKRHYQRLNDVAAEVAVLQFGGPVGTSHAQGEHAVAIAAHMAAELDLRVPEHSWHTQRDNMVDYANVLSMISGSLGKIGTDVALMAQQGLEEIKLSGGGRSSAMAHKHNPINAELLVTLARYNSTQVSAMHSALVHEQERSGSAWALEWMILPGMCIATGAGLQSALKLLKQTEWIGTPLSD